jgi:hypothetical protein
MGALRGRDNSAPQGRVCLSPKKEFDFNVLTLILIYFSY